MTSLMFKPFWNLKLVDPGWWGDRASTKDTWWLIGLKF